jgi:hypothetical protein
MANRDIPLDGILFGTGPNEQMLPAWRKREDQAESATPEPMAVTVELPTASESGVVQADERTELQARQELKMRLVRLRTNERDETPEYYLPDVTDDLSTSQGVWEDAQNPCIFYNTAPRPSTVKHINMVGKAERPSERHVIPSIVEILVTSLPDGEKAALWAEVVNDWRAMSMVTNDDTRYPLPLAYAERTDEYAEVIGPRVIPDAEFWESVYEEEDEEGNDELGQRVRNKRIIKKVNGERMLLGVQLSMFDGRNANSE